jgi:hypothetical protein
MREGRNESDEREVKEGDSSDSVHEFSEMQHDSLHSLPTTDQGGVQICSSLFD